jgi:hypothetical protein
MWSPNSKEIFYAAVSGEDHMMVVPYSIAGDTFIPEKPRPWSQTSFGGTPPFGYYGPGFDLHPDGKRFVVAPPAPEATNEAQNQLVFIFNFFDELRRRVPTGK